MLVFTVSEQGRDTTGDTEQMVKLHHLQQRVLFGAVGRFDPLLSVDFCVAKKKNWSQKKAKDKEQEGEERSLPPPKKEKD